jgi:hypothetical protein
VGEEFDRVLGGLLFLPWQTDCTDASVYRITALSPTLQLLTSGLRRGMRCAPHRTARNRRRSRTTRTKPGRSRRTASWRSGGSKGSTSP